MRQIGSTSDGGFIVEMNLAEITAFERLVMVIEGKTIWEAARGNPHGTVLEEDLSTAIECVNSYAALVGTLNEVERQVNAALTALTGREGETHG